jgi:hypothetical protein
MCRVRFFGFPLDVQARASEQHEELMREFALLAISKPTSRRGHPVPQRLIDLIDRLSREYGGVGSATDGERDAARERGELRTDLEYEVPAAVADACRALDEMLDEANEFCREGERLLTLAPSRELIAFRRWYLGEFIAQIAGGEPTSWSEYAAWSLNDDSEQEGRELG